MLAEQLLHDHLSAYCPDIHNTRLQSVMDVSAAIRGSKRLTLTEIGRALDSDSDIKHRIKKVDRLEGNKHLYGELDSLYTGLSNYVFKYLIQNKDIPLIIDVCCLKDTSDIQMLSAEIATKGRSIPLYREVFGKGELKGRAEAFIEKIMHCIPTERTVLVIMDAGFGDAWFGAIESANWYWLVRARQGKSVKLSKNDDWQDVGKLFSSVGSRGKNYPNAFITQKINRPCRIITKDSTKQSQRKKPKKLPRDYNAGRGGYQRSAKEPWILATNLPEEFKTTQVINFYKKRMQIEESFRDVKSHQFGLGGRDIRTRCLFRWGVKMLLAAIAQIMLWIIGIIGHSQGFQRKFQANTVKDKKVFSYFYLGKLIVEHNKLKDLIIDYENLPKIINAELARDW